MTFDADQARRHGQATRDHPAYVLAELRAPGAPAPRPYLCAGCGQPVRWVRAVIGWHTDDYHRRGHWRHYPEPPRELCDCGHDPDDHDMRAAPPRCQEAGCECGEQEDEE